MRSITLTALLLGLLAAPAAADDIQAMGGSYEESVLSIQESKGRLVVRTQQREIPLESVKTIRFAPASVDDLPKLILLSGDVLRGTIEGGDEDSVGLRSVGLGTIRVPLELVRAVLPAGAGERERALLALLKADAEIDWVRLKNGGTVKGSVISLDGTRVAVDTDAEGGSSMGEMSFDLDKVELVSIAPLDDPAPPADGLTTVLRLVDGSSLTGELLSMGEGSFTLRHALGGKGPLTVKAKSVAELIVRGGLFVYLSDLTPINVKQNFPPEYTYEVDVWGYKRDTNVTGGKLRLDGRLYEKGLGVHSYCELTYSLGGRFKEFKAVLGLDDSVRYLGEPGFGAVVFQVLLDGKPAKEVPTGIVKRKGDKASQLRVDVSGVKELTIVAGFDPTSLHVLGRADWADAHLIRSR